MRACFHYLLQPWAKLIADPHGFPDNPEPDRHWSWTGYVTTPRATPRLKAARPERPLVYKLETYTAAPRVKFLGKTSIPSRVMYAYHHDLPSLDAVPRLKHTCDDPMCINPLHWYGTHVPVTKVDKAFHIPTQTDTYVEPIAKASEVVDDFVLSQDEAYMAFMDIGVTKDMSLDDAKALAPNPIMAEACTLYLKQYQESLP